MTQLSTGPGAPAGAAGAAEAAATVRQLGQGVWVSGILQAATQLGLADMIDDKPVSVEELATRAGVDTRSLRRLLRALVPQGVFAYAGDDSFEHSEQSRALRADAPHGVRNLLLLASSEWNWVVWRNLAQAVRTGRPAFAEHYGKDLYQYFAQDNPEAGAIFNKSMTESAQWTNNPVAAALDVTGVETVADVGGGQGGLLTTVLRRHPALTGVLIDRDQVVAHPDPALLAEPLADRVRIEAADVRTSVPASAELYLLRQVMHIWDDDTATAILRNCVAGAPAGARVVLVEHVIEERAEANQPFSTLIDLVMMLIGPGRERTEPEFAALLHAAGLEHVATHRTPTPFRLIEGRLPA
jgi:C-methyltransferase